MSDFGMSDNDANDAALADAAGTLFHTQQFIEQLFVQSLLPFSALYLIAMRSTAAAANVLSIPRPIGCIVSMIFGFSQIMLTTPLVVFVAWSLPDAITASESSVAVLRIDVIVTAAMFTMHRLAISIKYGFQSKTIYARRMREWVSMQERLDDQLFSAWFKLSASTINRETRAALSVIDDDEHTSFSISEEAFSRLRASLHEDARKELDAAVTVKSSQCVFGVNTLASALINHVNEDTSNLIVRLQRVTSLIGIVATFGTTIFRSALGLSILGENLIEGIVIVGHWIGDFLLLPVVLTFLSVGFVDHMRRKGVLLAYARLFRPSAMKEGGGTVDMLTKAVRPPILQLSNVDELRAFLATRRLLLAFGSGFHSRLVSVLSADLCVLAAVAAIAVISALTAPDVKASLMAPVVLFHIVVAPGVALCTLGMWAAASANLAATQLVTVVSLARLRLRLDTFDKEKMPRMLALLEDVERTMRDNVEHIVVLGMTATPALASSLLGAFVSADTVLLSGVVTRLNALGSGDSGAKLNVSPSPTPVTTPSPTPSPSASPPPAKFGSPSSLSPGAIAGVVIAALVVAGLLTAAVRAAASRCKPAPPPLTISNPLKVVETQVSLPLEVVETVPLPPGWKQWRDERDVWYAHEDGRSQWENPATSATK